MSYWAKGGPSEDVRFCDERDFGGCLLSGRVRGRSGRQFAPAERREEDSL
jgi:hypothetical protein